MKTQGTTWVRLCALAAAGLAVAVAGPATAGPTNHRPVTALNGWNDKQGPGIGSTKTPFGINEVSRSQTGPANGTLYFDSSDGQAVRQSPVTHIGPGPWSPKSPSWGLYHGGSY